MNLPLSFIELSKNNLIHNIKELKKVAHKKTKIIVAIKGNAYGHGQNEITKIIEPFIDYFQVNSVSELKLLRKISRKKAFILGFVQKNDLKEAIKLGCILSVFSIENLNEINEVAKKLKIKQEVHIAVDAYLGREGFLKEDILNLSKEIKKMTYVKITGIYAHFANIEDTNNFSHAKKQIKKYEEVIKLVEKSGLKNLQTHMSATSGLLVYEKNKNINNLVRLGIGVYGMWPSDHIKYLYKNKLELKPVLSFKTKVAQVKTLPAGHTIGYGLTYTTYENKKIAVIPLGYADGLSRNLSNKGEVLIKGTRCKILGRISMNMFVVNVSHLDNVKIEDEVVIIGKQGKPARPHNEGAGGEEITAEEIAEKSDTINYEITTKISPLLPRVVV